MHHHAENDQFAFTHFFWQRKLISLHSSCTLQSVCLFYILRSTNLAFLVWGIGVYPYYIYSRYLNQKTARKRMGLYLKLVFVRMGYQVNSYWHSIPNCSKMKTLSMIMPMVRARESMDECEPV